MRGTRARWLWLLAALLGAPPDAVGAPQLLQPLAPAAAALEQDFGWAVAVDGAIALVGAPGAAASTGVVSGVVYVYERSAAGEWQQRAVLEPAGGRAGDGFGVAVALDGDTALIGADGVGDGGEFAGAAYVFVRSAQGDWSLQQQLLARVPMEFAFFGSAVALSGELALVGAPGDSEWADEGGAAYVFSRAAGAWSEQRKLTAADAADGDGFGSALALSGELALVGASRRDGAAADAGAAYVFERSDGGWPQRARLEAADAGAYARFGMALALEGGTALIGAPGEFNADGPGAVYVFAGGGSGWAQQQRLVPAEQPADSRFGAALALLGERALIGAPEDRMLATAGAGAAHLFGRAGASWSELQRLAVGEGAPGDSLGAAVALTADALLLGAPGRDGADGRGDDSGVAYVFGEPHPAPTAEPELLYLSPKGTVSVQGILAHDEDVLRFDRAAQRFELFLDGSDIGLAAGGIDALDMQPDGSVLLSLREDAMLPGLGYVADEDVVRFTPSSTGRQTAGRFARVFTGARHGLPRSADLDGISFTGDALYFSLKESLRVDGLRIENEDIVRYDFAADRYELIFDGSALGMRFQNLDAFAIRSDGSVLLSFGDSAWIPGLGWIDDEDVIRRVGAGAAAHFERYFDGDASGLQGRCVDIDGISVLPR